MLWVVVSSLVLWLLSFGVRQEFTFEAFIGFSSLLFGGGAAYHFFTVLLSLPYDEMNKKEWRYMLKQMAGMLSCFLFAGLAVVLNKLFWPQNGLLSLGSIFLFFAVAWFFAFRAEKSYKRLAANEP